MNEYRFSDLKVGMEVEFDQITAGGTPITITSESLECFRGLTGDIP